MVGQKSDSAIERLRAGDDVLGGLSSGVGADDDTHPEDAVELWARRTGRALAALATVGLIAWCVYQAAGAP